MAKRARAIPPSRPAAHAAPLSPQPAPAQLVPVSLRPPEGGVGRGSRQAREPARTFEDGFAIPWGYGDHRIVLMVKDPWWLYAYWEIQPDRARQVRRQLAPEEIEGLRSVLRVYDVTDRDVPKQLPNRWFDVTLSDLATNWYIHVDAPNRSFVVEIGLLTRTGRFLPLARSNQVTTPRFGPSEVIDEEWMSTDEEYWKLVGLTAGVGMGSSPAGLKEFVERKLFSPGLFSPGLFSPVKRPTARSFWLVVDTELIVHGATDPKASVTVQGQAVKLKPDGTFSVRMALPEDTQTIPVEATSPDHQETRTITPVVTRHTEEHTSDTRQQTTVKAHADV